MNKKRSNQTSLIIGLGNPGKKYCSTRHNIGFIFLDWFLEKNEPEITFHNQRKLHSEVASLQKSNIIKIILAKPQTFMNKSGFAARKILDFYKMKPENIIVIHDDLDLSFGMIRISKDSGPAGHNGVKSVIEQLGTKNFIRLRVGISNDLKAEIPSEKFVLEKFNLQEQIRMEKNLLPKIQQALNDLLKNGLDSAANKYNRTNP